MIAIGSGRAAWASTVAANLAVSLAASGARVGLLDADIYGPNLPRMLGVYSSHPSATTRSKHERAHGVRFYVDGPARERGRAVVWRGSMLHGAIKSFLHDVDWGELDYLLVDLPPAPATCGCRRSADVRRGRGGRDDAVHGRDRGRGEGVAMFEKLQVRCSA